MSGTLVANGTTIAKNRRARYDYTIEDTLEAGLVLTGTEVKSLRAGKGTIGESYAGPMEGELWLFNANIPEYGPANRFNHAPTRPRKLLLHGREVRKLMGALGREGMTLVPMALYFNKRGLVKLNLGLAKGKRKVDKRETEKERSWQRDKARILRDKG